MAIRITARDILLIFWINGFGAATLVQIAAWMMTDVSTAARRVRKLVAAGLMRQLTVPFLISAPFAPTSAACALARDPLSPLSGIRVGTWRHDSYLIDIERGLERHFGGWLEPERRIRASRRDNNLERAHLPDAIIHRPGGALIAIELELSAKGPARLQTILDGYAASNAFERVVYITDDVQVAAYIKRFIGNLNFITVNTFRTTSPHAARTASTSNRPTSQP